MTIAGTSISLGGTAQTVRSSKVGLASVSAEGGVGSAVMNALRTQNTKEGGIARTAVSWLIQFGLSVLAMGFPLAVF